jgi:hypothetical protein
MNLAMTLIVGTDAKSCETIVAHVEAYLGITSQTPTWHAKCRQISCRKNTGYHAKDPKGTTGYHITESDTELYLGIGPSWWGKNPTCYLLVLHYDTSRGLQGLGYKALTGRR